MSTGFTLTKPPLLYFNNYAIIKNKETLNLFSLINDYQ